MTKRIVTIGPKHTGKGHRKAELYITKCGKYAAKIEAMKPRYFKSRAGIYNFLCAEGMQPWDDEEKMNMLDEIKAFQAKQSAITTSIRALLARPTEHWD